MKGNSFIGFYPTFKGKDLLIEEQFYPSESKSIFFPLRVGAH